MIKKGPLIIETEEPIDNKLDAKKTFSVICRKDKKSENLYNILFEFNPEEKNITIKINEINDNILNINSIYSVRISLEDWNKLAPDPSLFNDISVIFEELNKIENKNCFLKFHDNSLDLGIKLREYDYDPIILSLKEEEKNEEEGLNPYKIIEENLNINKDNKRLEERIQNLEKEIELLKSHLPNYLDKGLFQKLKFSKIIKEEEQLDLINRGINKLFQKNIKDIIFKYEYKNPDKNNSLSSFIKNYNNLNNILLIAKTREYRSFGAFFQKKDNSNHLEFAMQTQSVDLGLLCQFGDYGVNSNCNIYFDPIQYPNSFFFSLDKLKIYNSNNSQYNIFENPSFIIQYDNYRNRFFGTEKKSQNVNEIIQNLQNKLNQVQMKVQKIEGEIAKKKSNTINGPYIQKEEMHITRNANPGTIQYINQANITNLNTGYNNYNKTIIDHSFILSNQQQFENSYLEVYEIKI